MPTDINDASTIVGNSNRPGLSFPEGFLRAPDGTFTFIPSSQAGQLSVVAVNSSGTVVGSFLDPAPYNPVVGAFTLMSGGQYSYYPFALPYNNLAFVNLAMTSINESGQVVGYLSAENTINGTPFASALIGPTNGALTSIVVPSYGIPTSANHINVNGDVVGVTVAGNGTHGFLYHSSDGTFVLLDAGTSGFTEAIDINASGAIIGTLTDTARVPHSFLRTPDGTYTVFDPPGVGTSGSHPIRINASGEILGGFVDNVFVSHGYIRTPDGTIAVLDEPDTVPASNYGTFVTGLNDSGTIVGYFYDFRTVCHAFIRQ